MSIWLHLSSLSPHFPQRTRQDTSKINLLEELGLSLSTQEHLAETSHRDVDLSVLALFIL